MLDITQSTKNGSTLNLSVIAPTAQDVRVYKSGSRGYISDKNTATILQFDLSSENDLASATQTKSLDVSAQETSLQGAVFSPFGTTLLVCGFGSDAVHEYELSIPWELDSATPTGNVLDVSAQTTRPEALEFDPGGKKLLVLGSLPSNEIYEYALASDWSVGGATYTRTGPALPAGIAANLVDGFVFSPDGKHIVLVEEGSGKIYQMDLSAAWDISTASDSGLVLDDSATGVEYWGASFSRDGSYLFVLDGGGDTVLRYETNLLVTFAEQKLNASYADASAADPKVTALIRPADVQRSIDTDVSNLAGGPNLYTVEAIFDIGELSDLNPYNPTTEKPRVFFVKDDQPGLRQGKNLLLKSYTIRDADPAVPVTCTFWG